MSEALEIVGLVRRFGATEALRGVSMTVAAGELFGLVGPDGGGKTTAIRCCAGLLDPDEGTVLVLGEDPRTERARERLGLMPQRYALYGDLSVDENLRFFGDLFDVPPDVYVERRARLLHLTRLARFTDRRAEHLSGGMYKKLALACALLHSPDLLLLDEPTNGVDPVSRRELWTLLGELVAGGTAVLVSTPYMDEAERCHRVAVLDHGRILAVGDPREIARGADSFESAFLRIVEAEP